MVVLGRSIAFPNAAARIDRVGVGRILARIKLARINIRDRR